MDAPASVGKQTVATVTIDIVLENIAMPSFYVDVLTNNYTGDIMYLADLDFSGGGKWLYN